MSHRKGILPGEFKQLPQAKMNREEFKEMGWTILAFLVMVAALLTCFLAAAVPRPQAREAVGKGGDRLVSPHSVAARRQQDP